MLYRSQLTHYIVQCKGKIERGPKELQRYEQELSDWSQQLANIKRFLPLQDNLNTLITVDLPAAQAALAAEKNRHPELSATVEAVRFFFLLVLLRFLFVPLLESDGFGSVLLLSKRSRIIYWIFSC